MNKIELKNEFGLDEKYFTRCKEIYDSADFNMWDSADALTFFNTTCADVDKYDELQCLASLKTCFVMETGPSHPDSVAVEYVMAIATSWAYARNIAARAEVKKNAKKIGLSKEQLEDILIIIEDSF
jgi:hypothetical protein